MRNLDIEQMSSDIRSAFERSGRRHILITGQKGSGKTTLAGALTGKSCAGFSSRAVAGCCVILKDNLSGDECVIGRFSSEIGKMVPLYGGFSGLGVKSLQSAIEYSGEVLLDEIGYLENNAEDFKSAVRALLDARGVILTVRKESTEFITELMSRSDVFVVDMDILRAGVGCVIMASGQSRRFGRNKLLEDFHGSRVFERAILSTDGLFEDRVVVTRHNEIASFCASHNIKYVLHDLPGRNDTIRLGLEALDGTCGCVFVPADQPLLKRETVMALLNKFLSDNESIWRVSKDNQVGMPVVFPASLYGELMTLDAGGGSSVIKNHGEMLRLYDIADEREMLDCDTPEALHRLRELWKK